MESKTVECNKEEESAFIFHSAPIIPVSPVKAKCVEQGKELLRIVPTEDGFDIEIPNGITMTEAAKGFIDAVVALLRNQKLMSKHANGSTQREAGND